MEFLQELLSRFGILELIAFFITSLVVLAEAYVIMRPKSSFSNRYEELQSKSFVRKILDFLEAFAPIKIKKDGSIVLNRAKDDE